MFDAEVTFAPKTSAQVSRLAELVWNFARSLLSNGQIADDYSVSVKRTIVRLLCVVPEKHSLETRFHDKFARKALRQAADLIKDNPKTVITGVADQTPGACNCQTHTSLHLFTHCFDDGSPLACGDCRQPVPLYRFPGLERELRDAALRWQWAYQACDNLWIHSGFGENWSYRQLSALDSGLNKDGLDLREGLEAALQLPVFYYLMRYRGRGAAAERKRPCPKCGGSWLLPESKGGFDFRCEPCRLLSSFAPQ